ncbi:MAG: glycerophosphodiester phosphodiesterase, partial [Chloroflexota bacterium]
GCVERLPLSAIRALDAGAWFGPQYAGEPAPTLAEVLDLCRGRALVDVEIKSDHPLALGLAHRVVDEIDRAGAHRELVVTSFNPLALAAVRRLRPALPTGLLYTGRNGLALARRVYAPWLDPTVMLPHDPLAGPSCIRYWHARRRRVYIWTVDGEERMRRLCLAGADGIITNRPDLLRTVLDRLAGAHQE